MGDIFCEARGLHNGKKDCLQTVPDKATNGKVQLTKEIRNCWKRRERRLFRFW